MKKRGISAVISTVIIILISITAIVIVWVVISNILSEGTEDVELGQFTLNLKVKQVKVENNGVHVTVKRNPGEGNLKEIKFFLSDGETTQEFKQEADIEELGEQTFILDYDDILTDISIAPETSSGQHGVIDEFNVPGSETVKTIPDLVSYWRFEGNANDDWGNNHGTVTGASLVNGRFGKAYEFDADGEMVEVPDHPSLQLEEQNMSILVWFYVYNAPSIRSITTKANPFTGNGFGMFVMEPDDLIDVYYIQGASYFAPERYTKNKWTHITLTQIYDPSLSQSTLKFYINSNPSSVEGNILHSADTSGSNLIIGSYIIPGYEINGIIDEVMIFNRTLTDDEIEYIYNLNLR
jgi:hypothetical protein